MNFAPWRAMQGLFSDPRLVIFPSAAAFTIDHHFATIGSVAHEGELSKTSRPCGDLPAQLPLKSEALPLGYRVVGTDNPDVQIVHRGKAQRISEHKRLLPRLCFRTSWRACRRRGKKR